jgi:hypothetical protein
MSAVYTVLTTEDVYRIEADSVEEAESLLLDGGHRVVLAARTLPPPGAMPKPGRWYTPLVLRVRSIFK